MLHLVDRAVGGVPVAVRAYIAHSPEGYVHAIASPHVDGSPAAVWHGLEVEHLPWDAASPPRAARSLRRLLAADPADVVHAHSSFPGFYARLLRARSTRRLVYTPHCFAFSRTDVGPAARGAFRLAERALAPRTTVLAACGPGEQRQAIAAGFAPARTLVIPHVPSIVVGAGVARLGGPADGRLRVGMMGRGGPQKDPGYFAARVDALRRTLPGRGVDATWIGDGDREALAGVRVTGWLSADAVVDELRQLDVYLHSAAWEGFPIALLDAFAAGLPLLVRPIPALPDLPLALTVDGGLTGLCRSVTDGGFARWSRDNRAQWAAYLGPLTPDAQRAALALAWG